MSLQTTLTTFEDWTLRVYAPPQRSSRVMLMLHGWTGDENSMWTFARSLPPDYWMIAPRAPYAASTTGYSWRMPPPPGQRGWPDVESMRPSAAMLVDLIDRWGIANAVDVSRFDVMGFSQGAAMSVLLALCHPERVGKLGVLAGFAPLGADELIVTRPLERMPVFVTHGTQDEMVPLDLARYCIELLENAGAYVTYCEAEVGHKVSAECRKALEKFFE